MADESMVRNLAAQAFAIWPQEAPLYARYALPPRPRVLDAGCGTGEITAPLAELFPGSHVLGVDIIDAHLELARTRYSRLSSRVAFEHQSVFELKADDASFDLTVGRHVIQSIPHPDRVLAELKRVTRSGGYLHLIAEDYGMLHFQQIIEAWRDGYVESIGELTPVTSASARAYFDQMIDNVRDPRGYAVCGWCRCGAHVFARNTDDTP